MQTTVTTKGQVTIPKQLRDRFGIRPGDRVEMAEEGGRVVLRPVRTLRDLRGAVRSGGVGAADERRVAREAVSRRVMGEMAGETDEEMGEEMTEKTAAGAGEDRAAEGSAGYYGQGRPDHGGRFVKGDAPNQDETIHAASHRNIPDQAAQNQRDHDQDVQDERDPRRPDPIQAGTTQANHDQRAQDERNSSQSDPNQRDPDQDTPDQRGCNNSDHGAGR